ncbi:hypothetical protein SDC9_96245 [bioreactor metagenome]|uniref:Uncharacterized protein n=1 Tax=bioreactor metagenome TaxID=1076179 RepID=A0A645A8J8_9ZZZZ
MDGVRGFGHGQRGLAATRLGGGHAQTVGHDAFATAAELRGHARRKHMLAHHRQLMLDGLELADGAAELLALVGVLQRALEHRLQRARHLRGNDGGLRGAHIGGRLHYWRRLPLRSSPLNACIQRQGLGRQLRAFHIQQARFTIDLQQHGLRDAGVAHQRGAHGVARAHAACQHDAAFGLVHVRRGQHGARQHGVGQRQGQRMCAALLQHAEDGAQAQTCAALFFRQHRIGQAGGLELFPQGGSLGGRVAMLLDGAHHVGCALVGQHLPRCVCKQIVVVAHVCSSTLFTNNVCSTQTQTARDHAAQNVARATAQRERGRRLGHVFQRHQQLHRHVLRIAREQVFGDRGGDELLQRRAQFLDQRGLHDGTGALREPFLHRYRHGAQRRQFRQHAACQSLCRRRAALRRAHVVQPLVEQHDGREQTLRPAALECQFGGDLLPALAFRADQRICTELHVLEEHFAEMAVARQILDRPHRHARQRQIDDHLRQPLVAVFAGARGAHQRDHVLAVVRIGGPDLLAVEQKALVVGHGLGAHTGQIRARVGLAHADAEKRLALADLGDVELLLRLGAVLQDQRCALAVGNPVRADGCAEIQKLFHQHIARERAAPATAILLGQRHTQPALGTQLAAELAVVAAPGARADVRRHVAGGFGQECAHFAAQCLVLRGDAREAQ